MAVPVDIAIRNLRGLWLMDKRVSDDVDPILKLVRLLPNMTITKKRKEKKKMQDANWLIRKTIANASITTRLVFRIEPSPNPSLKEPDGLVHLTIHQSLPAGVLKGVPEHRILDWKERKHKDFIFGEVIGRSRLIGSVQDEDGKLIPELDLQTGVGQQENESREQISNFLKDFRDPATATLTHSAEADADPCYIHDFVKSVKGQWVAEQVWGLVYINRQQYLARRIVVAKYGSYAKAAIYYEHSA